MARQRATRRPVIGVGVLEQAKAIREMVVEAGGLPPRTEGEWLEYLLDLGMDQARELAKQGAYSPPEGAHV